MGLLRLWVDPADGIDTATPADQVNDPDAPFKTLNLAIETAHAAVRSAYPDYVGEYPLEAVVFALPGLYGPHGAGSSGDSLPIRMLDRVHVRGLGAARTIIRGAETQGMATLYWPTNQPAEVTSTMSDVEVLVDLQDSHAWTQPFPPWVDPAMGKLTDDTVEFFDGFTLQGGDVQVLSTYSQVAGNGINEPKVGISNCVFDMRHAWPLDPLSSSSPVVQGPYIGIYMLKPFLAQGQNAGGYVDQKLLIANNTFVMAQWKDLGPMEGWAHESRPEAVGILDASDPLCSVNPSDCDNRVKGLGNPAIINNVFRIAPSIATPAPAAMLGIDQGDTRAVPGGSAPLIRSNAFPSDRVGGSAGTNGYFFSEPVVPTISSAGNPASMLPPAWYCQASVQTTTGQCALTSGCGGTVSCVAGLLPFPRVHLFDGTTGVDPGYVGEFMSVTIQDSNGQPTIPDYVDWRLLPGDGVNASPLKDQGFVPSSPVVVMENGTVIDMPQRLALSPFVWDGESYGNPRVVDNMIDIGHDEVHLIVMAGSYGNGSNSHNVPGQLNPLAPTGSPDRYVLVRETAGGVTLGAGNQLKVHGVQQTPSLQPPGWTIPPGVLSNPGVSSSLPADYRTKYISFNNTGTPPPPTPFNEVFSISSPIQVLPLNSQTGQLGIRFMMSAVFVDDEVPAAEHTYFNAQAVIKADSTSSGSILLRSNLQAEYR